MSSFISALVNQNTFLKRDVVTTQTSGNYMYATIYQWPTNARLDEVFYTMSTSASDVTMRVVGDGASFYANSNSGPDYFTSLIPGASGTAIVAVDCGGAYVVDQTQTGCLHLVFSASSFTAGTTITISVRGRILDPMPDTVSVPIGLPTKAYVSVLAQTPNNTLDVTKLLTGGTLIGDRSKYVNPSSGGVGTTVLSGTAANNYFYVGSVIPFSKVLMCVSPTTLQPAGSTVVYEYWNGTAWSTSGLTVSDNTSDHQASTPSGFSYSGCVTFSGSYASSWVPQKLANDPMTARETSIMNTSSNPNAEGPPGFWFYPARYWMRIHCPQLSGELRLTKVLVVS